MQVRRITEMFVHDKTDFFSSLLVVSLCSNPRSEVIINSAKIACIEIAFDRNKIDAAREHELTKLQIDLLELGLEKCTSFYEIPEAELYKGLKEFVAGGMKNVWTHKKRVFKKIVLPHFYCARWPGIFLRCVC